MQTFNGVYGSGEIEIEYYDITLNTEAFSVIKNIPATHYFFSCVKDIDTIPLTEYVELDNEIVTPYIVLNIDTYIYIIDYRFTRMGNIILKNKTWLSNNYGSHVNELQAAKFAEHKSLYTELLLLVQEDFMSSSGIRSKPCTQLS